MAQETRPILKNEDWWAVGFGGIIFALALSGLMPKIPKLSKWTSNPLDAFLVIKDGAVTGNKLLSLLFLLIFLAVLTAFGIAFIKKVKVSKYLPGFVGVFVLAIPLTKRPNS